MAETKARLKFDPKGFQVAYVEWTDHSSTTGWNEIAEVKATRGLVNCFSVGYVLKDTAEELVLSHTISDDGGAIDPISIDKRLVVTMQILPRRRPKRARIQFEGETCDSAVARKEC
jgi:hypothetical protein